MLNRISKYLEDGLLTMDGIGAPANKTDADFDRLRVPLVGALQHFYPGQPRSTYKRVAGELRDVLWDDGWRAKP